MSRKEVLCVFCNERGLRAREDIITRWFSAELNPTGPVLTDFFTDIPAQMIIKRTKALGDLRTIKLSNAKGAMAVGCLGWKTRRVRFLNR